MSRGKRKAEARRKAQSGPPAPASPVLEDIKHQAPDVLEHLDPQEQTRLLHVIQARQFSGPLPPPEILAKYDEIVPGAAERIMGMAESQSRHRQELESSFMAQQQRQSERGQVMGFIIGLVGISAAVLLAWLGCPVVAGIVGGSTTATLGTAFILGRVAQKRSLETKRNDAS